MCRFSHGYSFLVTVLLTRLSIAGRVPLLRTEPGMIELIGSESYSARIAMGSSSVDFKSIGHLKASLVISVTSNGGALYVSNWKKFRRLTTLD